MSLSPCALVVGLTGSLTNSDLSLFVLLCLTLLAIFIIRQSDGAPGSSPLGNKAKFDSKGRSIMPDFDLVSRVVAIIFCVNTAVLVHKMWRCVLSFSGRILAWFYLFWHLVSDLMNTAKSRISLLFLRIFALKMSIVFFSHSLVLLSWCLPSCLVVATTGAHVCGLPAGHWRRIRDSYVGVLREPRAGDHQLRHGQQGHGHHGVQLCQQGHYMEEFEVDVRLL